MTADQRRDYIVAKTFLDMGILYPSKAELVLRDAQVGHMLECLDSYTSDRPEAEEATDLDGHDEWCGYRWPSVYDADTRGYVRLPCSCSASAPEEI